MKQGANERYSCACDVPAHNYTWSFEPKLDWSAVYAGSKEIYEYFNDFAKKYHLLQYVKTEHQVSVLRFLTYSHLVGLQLI